ncbi:uncharacterized protein LOC130904797 [Corythoichthys intestinalis]|uniref:uncharacterized protein LOC130904797 n=1 Tax=Corythoichthys intestinalis TaxID=161448 RepID=UPI0025A5E554|nr:uncharacterized protein LOC130904797 [Corythoichthys intestinalis]XP_057673810.1 uncharacterized protein LOC130904797 [Corythoichthys intestinalis]XP_057673811.1 uncharacterized protein LOC130904797 [Corythoichthys intestinalis]
MYSSTEPFRCSAFAAYRRTLKHSLILTDKRSGPASSTPSMAPKNLKPGDLDEIKSSILKLEVSLTGLIQNQNQEIVRELHLIRAEKEKLKQAVEERDVRIKKLEILADDLDQCRRANELIISGLQLTPGPGDTVAQLAIAKLKEFGINMEPLDIRCCLLLPSGGRGPATVLMKLADHKTKTALLNQHRHLKGSKIFLNDNLTRRNAEIARKARQLKKAGKIANTCVSDCRILVKTQDMKIKAITSLDQLTTIAG